MDPWSWLPATAWEDREIRAYVPSTYLVTFRAAEESNRYRHWTSSLLSYRRRRWISSTPRTGNAGDGRPYAMFTTDEARALAAALDDAGLEQDGLLNAYQLDYQFDYHDESRDTVVHIVFSRRWLRRRRPLVQPGI